MQIQLLARPICLLLTCAAAVAQGHSACDAEFQPRSIFEEAADFSADPVPQIQAHLARVIERLEVADVSGLSAGTLENRRKQIAVLADYSAAAQFPIQRSPGLPTPIFIDDNGRACAVGHLMIESGAADLAARIAAESNFAYVPDITVAGAAAWMKGAGLSVEECAWIQPAYGPCGGPSPIHAGSSCTPATLNSAGFVATQWACGLTDVASNNAFLIVDGLPMNTVGYFLNARDASAMAQPGTSQGTLCLSGSIGRHDQSIFASLAPTLGGPATGPGWWAGLVLDLSQMPTPTGATAVIPGDTWYFQAWYRDVNPTATSNLSDVIWITFT